MERGSDAGQEAESAPQEDFSREPVTPDGGGESQRTRKVDPGEAGEVLEDFVSGKPEDATEQLDRDEARQLLEEFIDDED